MNRIGAALRELQETGFSGELVLEYEGDIHNPVPAVSSCVQANRREMPVE